MYYETLYIEQWNRTHCSIGVFWEIFVDKKNINCLSKCYMIMNYSFVFVLNEASHVVEVKYYHWERPPCTVYRHE
jgi:hypothetical protein